MQIGLGHVSNADIGVSWVNESISQISVKRVGLTFSHGSGDLSVVDSDAVLDEVVVEDQGGAVPVVKLNPKLTTCGRFN